MKGDLKKAKKLAIQTELLKNFIQDQDHYEEKKVGNEWYIKSFNGGTGRWQVSVFSEMSYKKYKNFTPEKYENAEKGFDTGYENFERPTLESIKTQIKKCLCDDKGKCGKHYFENKCIGCGSSQPTKCDSTLCDECWEQETKDDE